MAEHDKLVKLALDNYYGRVDSKFSNEDTDKVLRNALIDLNGGSETISRKTLRDGNRTGLFALIEVLLQKTVIEGLQGNEFFMNFVEYRNVALGDKNEFVTEDDRTLFVVAEVARGTGGIRRQRLGERVKVSIPTSTKAVRIYEELDRTLSGRATLNDFIDRVGRAFTRYTLDEIYAVFSSLGQAQLGSTLYRTGSWDEDIMLDLIEHVEAQTGRRATILGTMRALRNLSPSTIFIGDGAKDDMYNMGFFGKFGGTPTMRIDQRYKVGTETFIFPDNELFVVAGDEKFIKHITEGESIIDMRTGLDNIADFTQEYMYMEQNGTGLLLNNTALGKYKLS